MKQAIQHYMKTKVFTATPEQLQLMLYDGAIRFAEQGKAALAARDFEQSFKALTKLQSIVAELLTALRPDAAPDMCKNLAALYSFVYRRVVEANSKRKLEPLEDALRILKYQRETWVLLMQKLGKDKAAQAARGIDVPAPDARMEASISMCA